MSGARLLHWSVFIGLSVHALTSQAQVTAIARITLTVIPAPGIVFAPTNPTKSSSSVNQITDGGTTLHTSGNVAVVLNFRNHERIINTGYFRQGQSKILTSKELKDASNVEVFYLGN